MAQKREKLQTLTMYKLLQTYCFSAISPINPYSFSEFKIALVFSPPSIRIKTNYCI
jgi:hypothetical protein